MSDRFWRAKIRTLTSFLNLETIREILGNDSNKERAITYLNTLEIVLAQCLQDNTDEQYQWARAIDDASDRAIFNRIETADNSGQIAVKHLLSGAKLNLDLKTTSIRNKSSVSLPENSELTNESCSLPELFWWLWRCLPQAIALEQGANSLLIPASDNLPDASLWSNASLSAALAGALAGYREEDAESRPRLVIFSFSTIQEMIKASRKMRDFWAGSWLLHYLSARVCWQIANKYGADSLVYPSLYQQPLIDRWLIDKYPNFKNDDWIEKPKNRSLLTAGFPNVIVVVLPKSEVRGAMQTARQNLLQEWINVSDRVFDRLQIQGWMRDLDKNDPTWNGWLKSQWQTYWTALPLGKEDLELTKRELDEGWVDKQNQACNLQENSLFLEEEKEFIDAVREQLENSSINVGSWWAYTFDQLRYALSSVKKARTWTIPTAFTMRSTVSGIGSVVTPNSSRLKIETREEIEHLIAEDDLIQENIAGYQRVLGLFDGKEQLNATETVKRGLHFVLPELLKSNFDEKELDSEEYADKISASYPDLCSGVAGWLRTNTDNPEVWQYYNNVSQRIANKFSWTKNKVNRTKPTAYMPWGIPWIDEHPTINPSERYNPRLLNAGWAIEDFPEADRESQQEQLKQLKDEINKYFPPGNNPTDWYVIAVGDGDGMGEWLKGDKLGAYKEYLGEELLRNPPKAIAEPLAKLKEVNKRMGPSTHNALSRALLDFSNGLVPYLTEERYAGRLIYSGGDDVFAYTNLWEWDKWLWDVRQCFCGARDPHDEFTNEGDYWQWKTENKPNSIRERPLFTMGSKATISFGLVIAHHSVPLAIALENVWQAEAEAKKHLAVIEGENKPKDAVRVRVLFGNGNSLSATSKFQVFNCWQQLLETVTKLEVKERNSLPALLEQAAQTWQDHPAPQDAIEPWAKAFCQRRESLNRQNSFTQDFANSLQTFLKAIFTQTQPQDRDGEIQNWLKLAAFVIRNREIKIDC